MPDYVIKALFVLTGLMLTARLAELLTHARHPAARALLHAGMGLAALLMGNTVGALFGVGLGLNALTLPVSAVLSLPGVAAMWALRWLF